MAVIIAALYDHFYKMREKGRQVVPWVQTVFVCALEANLLTFMIGKNLLQVLHLSSSGHFSDGVFVVFFGLTGIAYFFIIKRLYFDTQKFTGYYEDFLQLPERKRTIYKMLVLGSFIIIPFLMVWKIWYDAK